MEIREKSLFSKLRPACTKVMATPTVESLCQLRDVLVSMETEQLPPPLAEYAAFPLKAVLVQRRPLLHSERFTEALLSCLLALWTVSQHLSLDTFREVYLLLCLLLGQDGRRPDHAPLPPCTEDVCRASLQLLSVLLARLTLEQLSFVFAKENLVMVGHCIAAILAIAQDGNSIQVKLACMECLYGFTGPRGTLASLLLDAPPTVPAHHPPTQQLFTQCGDEDVCTEDVEEEEEGLFDSGQLSATKSAFPLDVDGRSYLDGISQVLGEVPAGGDDVICPALSSFLPGVAVGLMRLVGGDRRTSSLVVAMATLTLTRFLTLLLSDSVHARITSRSQSNSSEVGQGRNSSKELLVERTPEWLSESADKMATVVGKVLGQMMHPAWRVRVAMVTLSHALLRHCAGCVPGAVLPLCEALIALSRDGRAEVAALAEVALSRAGAGLDRGEVLRLRYRLEDRLFALCQDLSGVLVNRSDAEKMATLNLLSGYLRLLGEEGLAGLTRSHAHLSALMSGLLVCLKMVAPVRLLEGRVASFEEPESGGGGGLSRPEYLHFTSPRVEAALFDICELLGNKCPTLPLVDHLLEEVVSGGRGSEGWGRGSAVVVLGRVLLGAGRRAEGEEKRDKTKENKGREEKKEEESGWRNLVAAVRRSLEVLLSPAVWDLPTQRSPAPSGPLPPHHLRVVEGEGPARSARQLASNVVLLRSAVQCVEYCAVAIGPAFSPLLMIALYPLLQRLGGPNACLAAQAHASLVGVARACGHAHLPRLLRSNADYLLSATSLRLRQLELYPDSAPTMAALLQHGGGELLPLVTDSIDELLHSLDLYGEEFMDRVWTVLSVAARCIAKGAGSEEDASVRVEPLTEASQVAMSAEETVSFFREYWRSSLTSRDSPPLEDDDDNSGDTQPEEGEGDETAVPDYVTAGDKPLPLELKMAVAILDRCPHFLPARSDRARLAVLDSAHHCVWALRDSPSALLPQVHLLWPAFAARFSDSSLLVTVRAVQLLYLLTETCRDFLRRRASKDLWPLLTRRLKALATESSRPRPLYHHTHAFKLQRALLRGCGRLCHALGLSAGDAEQLVLACLPYLSSLQPPALRQLGVDCLRQLALHYGDTVWFVLVQLAPPPAPPPHPALKPLDLPRVVGWGESETAVADVMATI